MANHERSLPTPPGGEPAEKGRPFEPYTVTLPAGTALNKGVHEDSDPSITIAPTQVTVLGPERDSAILVELLEDGKPTGETFHWHQPTHSST